MKKLFSTLILFLGFTAMSEASEVTIGYFPNTFPRDVLEINVYLEHVLIGQALEPLFTIGDDGQIKGAVAKNWKLENHNKTLIINLKENLQFSDGKRLTADDVIFSLERHVKNPASQSHNYLKKIKSLKKVRDNTIEIELESSYAPILKALSRDQLGILPKDWTFKKDSQEPFIGTGPYRIVKNSNEWYLKENPYYKNKEKIQIKNFKLKFLTPGMALDFGAQPADVMLLATVPTFKQFKDKFPSVMSTHDQVSPYSFAQYSYWWHKNGYDHFSLDQKKDIKSAIRFINDQYIIKFGGILSSGVIPAGILGALTQFEAQGSDGKSERPLSLKILLPISMKEFYSDPNLLNEVKQKFNLKIDVATYTLGQKIDELEGDLVLVAYVGGFFDPEGYLTVLPSFLKKSSADLFGASAEHFRVLGESELDTQKRAEHYRQFSKTAVNEVRYIPGWAPEFVELRKKGIKKRNTAFKYTYNLIDYFEAN